MMDEQQLNDKKNVPKSILNDEYLGLIKQQKGFLFLPVLLFLFACTLFRNEPIVGEFPLAPDPPQLSEQPMQFGQVVQVIDGDTIRVEIEGEIFRVRYIGINTPERGEPCYQSATDANATYVEGQHVRLVWDESNTDRHGRLLRYIYVDEILVNAELVAGGWAESRAYQPDTRLFEYMEELEKTAVAQNLGCHPTGIFD